MRLATDTVSRYRGRLVGVGHGLGLVVVEVRKSVVVDRYIQERNLVHRVNVSPQASVVILVHCHLFFHLRRHAAKETV